MTSELLAYLDGVNVGYFTQSQQGSLGFVYEDAYLSSSNPTPLSLSMPLSDKKHSNRVVRAWLEGLLPDNPGTRERWARQYQTSANNPFALLRHVGRDAAGAVQILPPGQNSDDAATRRGDVAPLSDSEVVDILRELALHGPDWDPGRQVGRWSLAGAQPKVALYRDPTTDQWGIPADSTPTTHILKPSISWLPDHHMNEALCLRAASQLGLPAAKVDIIEVGDVQALVSARYDRIMREDGQLGRIHQEDLCQALSVHPDKKYQSDGGPGVPEVADLLTNLEHMGDRDTSRRRFFDGLAFSVLIGGTDAHAKNYSLLLSGSRAVVAPLYDVATAAPHDEAKTTQSAMKIGDHWLIHQISASDWERAGRRLGLDAGESLQRVRHLKEAIPQAFADAADTFPESLRRRASTIAIAVESHVDATRSIAGSQRRV